MKRKIWYVLWIGVFLLSTSARASAAKIQISDSAGFFSAEEASVMEQNFNFILERYNTSVYLITSDQIGKEDRYTKYLKKQRKKIEDKDLLLLFVSSKKEEEVCRIQPYGTAKKNLPRKRLRSIEESVEKKLVQKDYIEACNLLYGTLLDKMATRPVFDHVIFHPLFHVFLCLFFVSGLLFLLLHRFGRKHLEKVPYLNEKYSIMIGKIDHFSHISEKQLKRKKGRKRKE